MELPTQWLLVGGPAHGKTIWVKGGESVMWAVYDGKHIQYRRQVVLFEGEYYCIGSQARLDDDNLQYVSQTLLEAKFARRNFFSKGPGDAVEIAQP